MIRKTFAIALVLATVADARRDRLDRGGMERNRKSIDPTGDTQRVGQRQSNSSRKPAWIDVVQDDDDDKEMLKRFTEWVQKSGKAYHQSGEFKERLENFKKNNRAIRENNKNADKSGNPNSVRLGHNQNSDLSQAEFEARFGLIERDDEDGGRRLSVSDEEPRKLSTLGEAVDLSQYTAPVLNQGQCGSCWAFAGNTVLTGTKRKNDPANPNYPVLSQQFPTDCFTDSTFNSSKTGISNLGAYGLFGCRGGHQERMWDAYSITGVIAEQDYPYVSGSNGGYDTTCEYSSDKVNDQPVVSRGSAGNTPESIRSNLESRPLTLAVAVHPQNFGLYESGIVESGSNFCWSDINHAMVITGYNPGDGSTQTIETTETWCRYRQWYDNYFQSGCYWSDEFYWNGYCCWEETTTETIASDTAYWTVQNSWGTNWGENGFIRYAVEDQSGVCGFNVDVDFVEVTGE